MFDSKKRPLIIAALGVATLTLRAGTTHAHEHDGKNYGGMTCKVEAGSAAPSSSAYFDANGRICNSSGTEPLAIICPIIKDRISDGEFHVTFDYVMWNLNGLNGAHDSHPDEALQCHAFSRTASGAGYYWSTWKDANDVHGYGATPPSMFGTVNATLSDGFIGVRCQLPRKYDNKMSCLSHLCVDEEI